MIDGLREHGFELLEAAAEARAAVSVAATDTRKGLAVYQPSYFDRLILPSGTLKFTPDDLSMYIREAEAGRRGRLAVFMTEMRARDGFLDGELQKQTDYITSANLAAQPYPPLPTRVKGGRITGDAKVAMDVSEFLRERYSTPEYHLDEALTALAEGEWTGVGGFQQVVAPDPTPGGHERVTEVTPLPSQRFVYEMAGTRLMFQPTGNFLPLIPMEDLGPAGSATLVVHEVDSHVPSPARRGVLRRCLNYWLIKNRGLIWWAQFVQNLGTPPLMGFYDPESDDALKILLKAFEDLGSGSKMVLPTGTDVRPLDVATRLANETPHQQIVDWCDRQVSVVVSGHNQSSGVQREAGSKQSSQTSDEQGIRRAQARAKRIARTLREQDAKPAVGREFGPDIAEKFTSRLVLRVERPKDLQGLAAAFKDFSDAGVETIPVEEFHELTGIRMAEEGEQVIRRRVAPAPAPTPDVNALARVLPFVRAASVDDPHAFLESLLRKAAKRAEGAGEEIVGPYRAVIEAAVAEGLTLQQIVVRVLHRVGAEVDAPELEDLLAATIAEAALRGVQLERKSKEAQ